MKGKKGWLNIVEAFVAILLITGVFLVIFNKSDSSSGTAQQIYERENGILQGIQINDSLRETILGVDENNLPMDYPDFPIVL